MNAQPQIKHSALLMALAAAYPLQAFASAGVTQFATGEVGVKRAGTTQSLGRGEQVQSGDEISTGANGTAQIRFSDGGLVSLRPNSQFNITRYSDANDPKQDAFLVDFLRGGMRALTGLIGKRNRENYKVTTTTATIGIRGSGFDLFYDERGNLLVSAIQDAIEVCTRAGCTGLTVGESARVVASDRPVIRTSTRANLPPLSDPRPAVVVGDGVTGGGNNALVPNNAPRVYSGMALAGMGFVTTTGEALAGESSRTVPFQRQSGDGAVVVAMPSGNPTRYLAQGNTLDANLTKDAAVSVVKQTGSYEAGDLMILGTWGASTWKDATTGGVTYNVANAGFAAGQPTPSSGITALNGLRGEYALAAATPVISSGGVTGELLPSSKLTVDFIAAGNYIDVNLNVKMANTLASLPALTPVYVEQQPFPAAPDAQPTRAADPLPPPDRTTFNLRGTAGGTGALFSGTLAVTSAACINGVDSCGTGSVQGFFGGPNAAQAGLSFYAESNAYGSFGGAGTFARSDSTVATPLTTLTNTYGNDSNLMVVAVDASGQTEGIYSAGGYYDYYGHKVKFTGNTVSEFNVPNWSMPAPVVTPSSGVTAGAIGQPGDADYIGWGVWSKANWTTQQYNYYTYSYENSSRLIDSMHYLVGRPTPASQMPGFGSATYNLMGGTAPTAYRYTSDGPVITVGELLSGSLSANFSTSFVSLSLTAKFGTTTVNIAQGNTGIISGSRLQNCGGTVNFEGFFSGNGATRAGLIYDAGRTPVGQVQGAAVFQRGAINPQVFINPNN